MKPSFCILSVLLVATSCSFKPQLNYLVNVKIKSQQAPGAQAVNPHLSPMNVVNSPADASAMECVFVNVTGYGVPDRLASSTDTNIPWDCLALGSYTDMMASSKFFKSGTTGSMTISVPSGAARSFQVLGVVTGAGSAACDGKDIQTLLTSGTNPPALFVLGSQNATQLYADGATVTINNTYTPATTPELVSSCILTSIANAKRTLGYAFAGNDLTGYLDVPRNISPPNSAASDGAMTTLDNNAGQNAHPLVDVDPAEMGMTTYYGQIGALQNTFETSLVPDVTSEVARYDFLLDLANIPVSEFRQVIFTITGGADTPAFSAGSCATPNFSASNLDVRIWDPVQSSWVNIAPSIAGAQYVFAIDENSTGRLPSTYAFQYTIGQITPTYTSNFIHISIRPTFGSTPGSNCSSLQVQKIQVQFNRLNQ